ncbi:MAG: hypothetical protein IKO95_00030 [Spirochaetia bacterium]|nr:hypothetical protein [Oscillospiraceae bacterium]MBR4683198.1 hypothetical protein [Spirochaetia bacterium]
MKKTYIRTKTLELTGEQTDELIMLVRHELQELDAMPTDNSYGKWILRRQGQMNLILDKLLADDFTIVEVEE